MIIKQYLANEACSSNSPYVVSVVYSFIRKQKCKWAPQCITDHAGGMGVLAEGATFLIGAWRPWGGWKTILFYLYIWKTNLYFLQEREREKIHMNGSWFALIYHSCNLSSSSPTARFGIRCIYSHSLDKFAHLWIKYLGKRRYPWKTIPSNYNLNT